MRIKTFLTACLITTASITLASAETVSIADVKALAKAGMSEDVILSQIRNAHSTFSLSTTEIIELKDAGVSQKVIDFMINTPTAGTPEQPAPASQAQEMPVSTPAQASGQTVTVVTTVPVSAPVQIQEVAVGTPAPAMLAEAIPPAPYPDFVWISGCWVWRHMRLGFGYWEWVPGYWVRPPYRDAIWINGGWRHRGWRDDHWR